MFLVIEAETADGADGAWVERGVEGSDGDGGGGDGASAVDVAADGAGVGREGYIGGVWGEDGFRVDGSGVRGGGDAAEAGEAGHFAVVVMMMMERVASDLGEKDRRVWGGSMKGIDELEGTANLFYCSCSRKMWKHWRPCNESVRAVLNAEILVYSMTVRRCNWNRVTDRKILLHKD